MSRHTEKNAKQRKARWIHAKNRMCKYPECAYGGDFYCDHVYEPDRPWKWVDFSFFHTKLKRYYAVAMVTVEYAAFAKVEIQAMNHVEHNQNVKDWCLSVATLEREYAKEPQVVKPNIELHDYGSVAIGMYATVNREYIDEHVIREFIAFFRSLGEPIQPGWSWYGEEVTIAPAQLESYFRRD